MKLSDQRWRNLRHDSLWTGAQVYSVFGDEPTRSFILTSTPGALIDSPFGPILRIR